MKNFLVLGIGNAQKDLLNALKSKYITHACGNSKTGHALYLADFFSQIDIKDKEAIMNYCIAKKIDYIYSIGSDMAMPTVSWVSEKLNLPHFVSYDTAITCNKKHKLREKLKRIDGGVKFFSLKNSKSLPPLAFPFILKPDDSQGQRGVNLIRNIDEYYCYFPFALSFSTSNSVIAEEFIDGFEISVNAFIVDGNIVFNIISDRISWPDLPGGIIQKHVIPSKIVSENGRKNVERLMRDVVKELNIERGPVYMQIIMQGDTPKLIEVTPRLDGCHMWNLIKMATGIDILSITIETLTKNNLKFPSRLTYTSKSMVLEFFCFKPGSIFHSKNCALNPKKLFFEFFYSDGEVVEPVNGYMEKCGYQIYKS